MAKTVAEKQSEAKPVIAVNETEIKAQLEQLTQPVGFRLRHPVQGIFHRLPHQLPKLGLDLIDCHHGLCLALLLRHRLRHGLAA